MKLPRKKNKKDFVVSARVDKEQVDFLRQHFDVSEIIRTAIKDAYNHAKKLGPKVTEV
jgi:hypothetical protein